MGLLKSLISAFNKAPRTYRAWTITLCFLAVVLNTLPQAWLMFVPIAAGWFAIAMIFTFFVLIVIEEWDDG
jgi:hypothetical protein